MFSIQQILEVVQLTENVFKPLLGVLFIEFFWGRGGDGREFYTRHTRKLFFKFKENVP
jgi:hypothetical protein